MSSDTALEVRNLTKHYRVGVEQGSLRQVITERAQRPWRTGAGSARFTALQDVSFNARQGEVLGLIGNNGAGKSTLLKILSRVTVPDAGEIDLYGRVGSLLEVGTGFHPELTGRENVYLSGAILGMRRSEIAERFDEIVEFAEIGMFLDTPVKRYSSGMYVRLAFAVAAHLSAEIMLVDEVLAVGDAAFQARCLAKMEAIVEGEGRTVLFVSHNLASVRRLCQRVLLLEGGCVTFDGPPREGVAKYLTELRPEEHPAEGRWSLEHRENPHGDGMVALRAVTTIGSDGRPTEVVRMLDAMTIAIELATLERYRQAVVGVQILNEFDQVVAGFTADYDALVKTESASANEPQRIDLHLPALPLGPGAFSIHLGIAASRGGDMVDEVRRAARFEVTATDMDKAEWHRTHGEASVFVSHSWERHG